MKITVVQSPHKSIDSVTLFIENKPDDFIVNHLLNIVEDTDDLPEMITAKKYTQLPLSAIASDRKCMIITPIKFKKTGVKNEQSRPSTKGIRPSNTRRRSILNFKNGHN